MTAGHHILDVVHGGQPGMPCTPAPRLELYPAGTSKYMAGYLKPLFTQAVALNIEKGYDASSASPQRGKLEQALTQLLQLPLPEKDNLAITLQKKSKIGHQILCFLHNKHVSPDNNVSERAKWTLKVLQKVSGGFRSTDGADAFGVIRPIIDPAIKSGLDVFHTLSSIATFGTG